MHEYVSRARSFSGVGLPTVHDRQQHEDALIFWKLEIEFEAVSNF